MLPLFLSLCVYFRKEHQREEQGKPKPPFEKSGACFVTHVRKTRKKKRGEREREKQNEGSSSLLLWSHWRRVPPVPISSS